MESEKTEVAEVENKFLVVRGKRWEVGEMNKGVQKVKIKNNKIKN